MEEASPKRSLHKRTSFVSSNQLQNEQLPKAYRSPPPRTANRYDSKEIPNGTLAKKLDAFRSQDAPARVVILPTDYDMFSTLSEVLQLDPRCYQDCGYVFHRAGYPVGKHSVVTKRECQAFVLHWLIKLAIQYEEHYLEVAAEQYEIVLTMADRENPLSPNEHAISVQTQVLVNP